jgi:hypothetical protein
VAGSVEVLKKIVKAIFKYYRDEKFLNKGMCPLHACKFLKGEVPIKYGRISHPAEYLDSRNAFFPCARSFITGGCLVRGDGSDQKSAVIDYCEECRVAQAAYLASKPADHL